MLGPVLVVEEPAEGEAGATARVSVGRGEGGGEGSEVTDENKHKTVGQCASIIISLDFFRFFVFGPS